MQIQTSQPLTALAPSRPAVLAFEPSEPSAQEPKESFTFSASGAAGNFVVGAIPIFGAGVHGVTGFFGDVSGNRRAVKASSLGVLTNLSGTASLLGGLIFRNHVAAAAGLGLLGVSGLASAYVSAHGSGK